MLYMVTFTISIPQMLAYIPYMDPMGYYKPIIDSLYSYIPMLFRPLGALGAPGIFRGSSSSAASSKCTLAF